MTATTRKARANEVDGVDYIFVSEDEFRRMVDAGEMLEHAEVYGNLYGVPRSQVADALEKGLDVIVKIDVQGAATLRRVVPDAVFIFMAAPSMDRLEDRLRRRMTESPDALRVRLETARAEVAQAKERATRAAPPSNTRISRHAPRAGFHHWWRPAPGPIPGPGRRDL